MTDVLRSETRGNAAPRETKASEAQLLARKALYDLFDNAPIPTEELVMNLGLFMRSSALTKILFLNELYEQILYVPGVIMEFGCWLGQNLAVFENLRAIHEPFNQNRRIVGFDTFTGYSSATEIDGKSDIIHGEGYALPLDYQEYLKKILAYHESNNVLSHIQKHQIVQGDVVKTVPEFMEKNPGDMVALGYFDLALYQPTKACLTAIRQRLMPGSVLLMDEFNFRDYPGATVAFREVFSDVKYSIRKSRFMTDRAIVVVESL
jgi:hypothetical protein